MTQNDARQVAHSLMTEHGLIEKGWRFDFNTSKRNFGLCYYGRKMIYLSKNLMLLTTDHAQVDTILHEIAHALTPGHHHNAVWRSMCIKIGGNGKRCAPLIDRSNPEAATNAPAIFKYTLKCPVCDHKKYISRNPKRVCSCGKCNPAQYDTRFKLILTQNY